MRLADEVPRIAPNDRNVRLRLRLLVDRQRTLNPHHMAGAKQRPHGFSAQADTCKMSTPQMSTFPEGHFKYLPIDQFDPLIPEEADLTHSVIFPQVPTANLGFGQ